MNAAHTPELAHAISQGQWALHPPDLEGRSYDYRVSAGGMTIAFVCADIPRANAEANGRLIVQAPTLLQATERAAFEIAKLITQRDALKSALEACAAMLESLAGPDDRTIMANYVNPARAALALVKEGK